MILDELAVTFGGAGDAASNTFGGQIDTVKDRLGEFAETIGMALLPGLQSLTGWLASPEVAAGIEAFATSLSEGIGTAIAWLTETAIPWLTRTALPALQQCALYSRDSAYR